MDNIDNEGAFKLMVLKQKVRRPAYKCCVTTHLSETYCKQQDQVKNRN